MKKQEIQETLEKQLQLLSERSQKAKDGPVSQLIDLSDCMCRIAQEWDSIGTPPRYWVPTATD